MEADDDVGGTEPMRRHWQRMSGLPASGAKRRSSAEKKTRASAKASKRTAKQVKGIRHRRQRRFDD